MPVYDKAASAWTDRFSFSFKENFKNKFAVRNPTTGKILFGYWNIESLKRAGIQGELLQMMLDCKLLVLFLQETKCEGEDSYRSGEFYIIKIGRPRREPYGVAVIIHQSLMPSVLSIRAVSHQIIYIQLKIRGGKFTLIGIYAPHEGRPEEEREDFFNTLSDVTAPLTREGPVAICGDCNSHLNYRRPGEEFIIGPHLFCKIPPQAPGGDTENRDLLAHFCEAHQLAVANTFLPKREMQQVTYFDRRALNWNARDVDRTYHKQLDLLLITQSFRGAVLDIKSKRDVRIGATNHHLQIAKIRMPLQKREKSRKKPALPWDIWKNEEAMASLREELTGMLESLPTQAPLRELHTKMLPDFNPISNDTCSDPLLIYYDGSAVPRGAGWAFAVFTWQGALLFERWGPVISDSNNSNSLQASTLSNNSGELSAFGESMIWLICECPFPWWSRGVVFSYDSTYSVGAGTAEWKTSDNIELVKILTRLWVVFDVDRFPVFGMKIKSHTQNPFNDYVDERAKWGAGVPPAHICPNPRRITTPSALERADGLVRHSPTMHSAAYADPFTPAVFAGLQVSQVYGALVDVGQTILEHLRAWVGPKAATRPYISAECLPLLAEKDRCWQLNDQVGFINAERKIRKAVAKSRREFIQEQIAEKNWKGVKMCKPYTARPHRVQDANGRERPLQERAEVLGTYYATSQWHTAQLPPLPQRPPLFPIADLPCGNFTPFELRKAKIRLKKKKTPGTDNITNEILLVVLEDPRGFSYILELMNKCWAEAVLPEEWQMARIVAIYKGKGVTTHPKHFRPIALLQSTYKLFTTLIELRLRGLEHRVWHMQTGYRTGLSTDDANHMLLRAMELALRWQDLSLYMFFLDWQKCYDRIHHERLLDAVRRMGVPPQYLKVLRAIYSRLRFYVWDQWGTSSEKFQDEGMRQGDPLSCFLLVLLMTVIMLDTRAEYVRICDSKGLGAVRRKSAEIFGFEDVEFADDSNFIQSSLPCMRVLVKCYVLEGRIYGLEANHDKSLCLAIRKAPGIAVRVKHPDGWFFKVEDTAKTLGFIYGKGFNSAAALIQSRIGEMLGLMRQYKNVWASPIALKDKVQKMQALVWGKGRWGVHLVHLTKTLRRKLDGAQARILRRLAKIPAAYISRVSNATVRRRCYKATRFSTQTLRMQCRWLGHVLRRPEDHPLRLVCFEPGTELRPRLTGTDFRRVRGKPREDWAQIVIARLCQYLRKSRLELLTFAKDKRAFELGVERFCKFVEENSVD